MLDNPLRNGVAAVRSRRRSMDLPSALLLALLATGCSSSSNGSSDGAVNAVNTTNATNTGGPDGSTPAGDGSRPLAPTCEAAGGSATVAAPTLKATFKDRWHEGWVASPAVVDLDGDGKRELVAPRDDRMLIWNADGTIRMSEDMGGRIWAPPVIADLGGAPGLDVAVASRGKVHAWDNKGAPLPGFPVTFRDEMRAIAGGDIDGDGKIELVVVTTNALSKNKQNDIIVAIEGDGSVVEGFPPNTTGRSGCDNACYVTGGYDQNVALGDVDGDGKLDILATQDNAYISLHRGDGTAFDAASTFQGRTKWPGIRFLHDYALAKQGYPDDESSANQAHFTNSAPAIADLDGDGAHELIVLGSVQSAAQDDRERGVGLWVLEKDGTRSAGWEAPFHAPDFLGGLWDFDGTNVVAMTNQVTVADILVDSPGFELIFAGFDGRIHCVSADKRELWTYTYSSDARVLTAGVAIADLSRDGIPEIVLASYSPDDNKSHLFVLGANGKQLHKLSLPGRGVMAVPTIADLDGDGALEIVVSLKDGNDKQALVQAYTVSGSAENCMPWPTGRGNVLRNGYVPVQN